jgi:hypothetical protein
MKGEPDHLTGAFCRAIGGEMLQTGLRILNSGRTLHKKPFVRTPQPLSRLDRFVLYILIVASRTSPLRTTIIIITQARNEAKMPFTAPEWVPKLQESDIPSSISLDRFMLSEQHGRHPISQSRPPFTCALSGKSYSATEIAERVDHLARALCDELGFKPDEGSEWDKVVAIFSLNTIDYTTVAWAVHRIGGILTCVSAAYNSEEVAFQLRDSGAKAVFTCAALLETCKKGIAASSSPDSKVFILPLPEQVTPPSVKINGLKTIDDLIRNGSALPQIQPSDESWQEGEGATRIAFLCYSSGTSGLPKGVKISHKNCISNILQIAAYETLDRREQIKKTGDKNYTESCLGNEVPPAMLYIFQADS